MRARVNPVGLMTGKQQAELRRRVEEMAAESVKQQETSTICRWYKLLMLALNQEYGFGADRLARVCAAIDRLADEERRDLEFWTHADIRLKQLGVDAPEVEENI